MSVLSMWPTAAGFGARGSAVDGGIALQAVRPWVRLSVSLEFFIFQPHHGPGVDSALKRNE
jgi:hypothetical protein